MSISNGKVHPYIPNSAPVSRRAMLEAVGVESADELFDAIPEHLKLDRPLQLPEPILSELELRRKVGGILQQNISCNDALSFLGGGVWQHDIPAVCDEINSRAEFLTAYGGDTYADLGKYQAIFEYQSMIGELVGMEMVSGPVYDWSSATASALMMAARITGKTRTLVSGTVSDQRWSQLKNTSDPWLAPERIAFDPVSGKMDMANVGDRLGADVSAVYIEVPGYLGNIDDQVQQISELAHASGALFVVGVDAMSLGVMAPPAEYGADIVVGETQPFGVHMMYSGGLCGFIASRDEPAYVEEYPYLMVSIAPGRTEGEWGFGWSSMSRTSYDKRETAPDYTGTTQWLWGITAAVYLSMLGPVGLRELGAGILQRSHYAMDRLDRLPGVRAPGFETSHFKEFLVDFSESGKTVAEINDGLRQRGIFGGHDLSAEFDGLDQRALYCVTEIHRKEDIDRLAGAIEEIVA